MPNEIDSQLLRDIIFYGRRLVRVVCVGAAAAAAATEMIKDGVNSDIFVYYGSGLGNSSVTHESVCEALTDAHTVIIMAAIGDCDVDKLTLIGRAAQSIELLTIGLFTTVMRLGDDHNLVSRLSGFFDTVILEPIHDLPPSNAASVEFLNAACAGLAEIHCGRYLVKANVRDLDDMFSKKGKGFIGFGMAAGSGRGPSALKRVLAHPGLKGVDLSRARGALFIFKINTSATDSSSRMKEVRALMKVVFELHPTYGPSLFSNDVDLWFTAVESDTFSNDECSVTLFVTGFA
jgi:cell division GTPase FtsZ